MPRYLICAVGAGLYGLEARLVKEVVRMSRVTPIAETPPDVRGVVDYRGELVVVLDPSTRLGADLSARAVDALLVVLEDVPDRVALVVDAVRGLNDGAPRPAPNAAEVPPFVRGHIDDDGDLVTVLDVDQLIRPEVRDLMASTLEAQPDAQPG